MDITNRKNIIILVIILIIIFAIVYLFISKKSNESFTSYLVNSNDSVKLASLDVVKIGSENINFSDILDSKINDVTDPINSSVSTILNNSYTTVNDVTEIIKNKFQEYKIAELSTDVKNLKDQSPNLSTINYVNSQTYASLPPYSIVVYAGGVIPGNWQECNGDPLKYTDGSLTGSTTPDLRGRTIIGVGTGSNLTTRDFWTYGGSETHTLTANEMPQHNHTISLQPTQKDYGNMYGCEYGSLLTSCSRNNNEFDELMMAAKGPVNIFGETSTTDGGNYRHRMDNVGYDYIGFTGRNQPHNNMQPYCVLKYIIKQPQK